LYHFILLLY